MSNECSLRAFGLDSTQHIYVVNAALNKRRGHHATCCETGCSETIYAVTAATYHEITLTALYAQLSAALTQLRMGVTYNHNRLHITIF